MLNYLWGGMILLAIVWGAFTGNLPEVTDGALDGAASAISLCITMLGVISLWMGLMEVARRGGVLQQMTRLISPFLNWMFPAVPKDHPAREAIGANMVANILGLGWAATPPGLKAMEELQRLEEERKAQGTSTVAPGVATQEMCNFLIINISSLQLIPVNIIAYRSEYGAASPADIVAPALLATLVSTIVGVIFCKLMSRKKTGIRGIKKFHFGNDAETK